MIRRAPEGALLRCGTCRGYSAYAGYQAEGATAGLFDGVRTEETVQAVRAEYGAALEALVSAVRRQEAGEITASETGLITAGLAARFGLTEGQTAVLRATLQALATIRPHGAAACFTGSLPSRGPLYASTGCRASLPASRGTRLSASWRSRSRLNSVSAWPTTWSML